MESKDTDNSEYVPRRMESTDVLVEPRAPRHRRGQHHIPTEAESATAHFDETSLEELKRSSRAILYYIVNGSNSDGENRLLRELYWHTVKILARLESNR